MEDESEISVLDVMQSMMESDRDFYQILRFMAPHRHTALTIHQQNTAAMLSILRLHMSQHRHTNVTYTATIPINLPAGWNDPIVVAPTAAQIAAGTTPVDIHDCTCAICQDDINGNGMRLRHCQHVFHDDCIAEWFTRSVHCPNCRHDIRETGRAVPTSSAPVNAPPQVSRPLDGWLEGVDRTDHTEDTEEFV